MPDIKSKFLPSNVMSWGTALFRNNQNKTISIGILMVCKRASVFMSKPSIKAFPFEVERTTVMPANGSAINSRKRGGKVLVTVKKPVAAIAD